MRPGWLSISVFVGVSDGDTITVLHNGKSERIRLHGIDCPEKRCPIRDQAGARSTNLTSLGNLLPHNCQF